MPTTPEKTVPTSLKLPASVKAQIDGLAARSGMTAHAYMVKTLAQTAERARLRAQFLQDAQDAWDATESSGKAYHLEDIQAYYKAKAAWRRGESAQPAKPELKSVRS